MCKVKRFFTIWLLFLSLTFVDAQSLFYTEYKEDKGLENKQINIIVQDDFGFLWIGTMNGLYRFDGKVFTEILFNDVNTDKSVYDLKVKNDVIWIAGKNGITSFDGTNFKYYGIKNQKSEYYCNTIEVQDDKVYFTYGMKYLYHIHKNEIRNLEGISEKITSNIIGIYTIGSDTLILFTETGKWYLNFKNITEGPFNIHQDVKTCKLISKESSREFKMINETGVLKLIWNNKNQKLESEWKLEGMAVDAYLTDSLNNTWQAYNKKIVKIQNSDTLIVDIGVPIGHNTLFFKDKEGNLWIAVRNHGLYKFSGEELTRLTGEQIENYTPSSYLISDDKLWISYFGAGVKTLENKLTGIFKEENGLISNYVRNILQNGNEMWFITSRGITRKKNNVTINYTFENGLPHNYCYHGIIGQDGHVYVGTERGLAIFENEKFHSLDMSIGLSGERVKFLYPTQDGSILIVTENAVDIYQDGKVNSFLVNKLNRKEILNTLVEDQFGNFWLGSDLNGLIFYNKKHNLLKYVSKDLNLPFSRVRAILTYQDQYLCLGTERGIFYCEINEDGELVNILPCGMELGYQDFEVNQNAVLKLKDKIYFGTSLGTIIFSPNKMNVNASGPIVNITGFDVSFKETDWTKTSHELNTWFEIPKKPILDYSMNDLLFHFQGISLRSGDNIWYKYMLENFDNTWSEPTLNTSAIYANLLPGNYNFLVKASYDRYNWTDNCVTYSLIIAPPFWKTWWFYVLVFSFMLAGFILFNNYRIKTKINQLIAIERLKKEEYSNIQKKVAMDFHDEVGNHLTSISLLIELIKNKGWDVPNDLKKLLDKIDDESKNLFRGTKDFIWSIDPLNDNLKAVFYNIRDYGIELFDDSSIRFHVLNGTTDIDEIKLPAGFTRQIVLIFKEGLNNVFKHAGCGNVYFSILVSAKDFEIKLKDDGRGFNEEELQYLEGIKKMKYRGAKIKSDLLLLSDEKLGTEIILKANI